MLEIEESAVYEFTEFRFEAKSRRLYRRDDGQVVPLQPKAAELLLFLVRNSGRLLTKAEILDAVWADNFVEEANLSQTIFVLRKALGENSKEPHFILTVPGHGYRFIAPVKEIDAHDNILDAEFLMDSPHHDADRPTPAGPMPKPFNIAWLAAPLVLFLVAGIYWLTRPAEAPKNIADIKTIAILPFQNIGGKADEEYLGQGLAEVLITKLSNIKTIVVRPASAVLKYGEASPAPKKIGQELDVEAVLTGRLQKVGERIRVTAQLVRVEDDATLWAATFDEPLTDIFAVQDAISERVAESLSVPLTAGERQQLTKRFTANSEAFQTYLQGRYLWNKRTPENLLKAAEQFEKAKQLDPQFALAYVGLADCYVLLAEYRVMPPRESFPKAREAVSKALEIDNELAEVHTSMAYILAFYEWDFPAAEREFRRAIEQKPNYAIAHQWYAEYLQTVGRFDESLAELRRAEAIDLLSLIIKTDFARYFYFTRQYDQAIAQSNNILAIDPKFGWGYSFLWISYKEKGQLPEAIDAHNQATLLFGGSAEEAEARKQAFARLGWKGYWQKFLEQSDAPARRPFVQAFDKAAMYQEIGDKEQALDSLQQSFERREHWLLYIKFAPQFDSLRDDPRFQELLRRMGLP